MNKTEYETVVLAITVDKQLEIIELIITNINITQELFNW